MANLSQIKRQRMLSFLDSIRNEHIDDDDILIAIGEIENEINSKKYGLVWEEHEEQVDIKMQDNIPVFIESKDKEITTDSSQGYNFLLDGDNLHSLKLLEKTHKGQIDVIYIDPPYNTGNKDFMYNDAFVDSNDGFKHSKWLSFMSKRLLLAKNLLADEGVIFISINNYEFAQLKMLCDEIFGENNFLSNMTWESTTQPINAGSAKFQLQQKVEPIFCYAKSKNKKNTFLLEEKENTLKYPHQGKFGKCRFEIIEKSDAGQYKRETMKYLILGQPPREGKRWQIGEETARELEKSGKIEIVDGIVKKAVYPEDEIDKISYTPFWSHLPSTLVGTALNGKDELNSIMQYAAGFDTVKPVKLITELLSHFHSDIIVLDFFAGSGTTAQAVLDLNKRDGGNRKFILCTNNENNICEDITYKRISNVINGYGDVAGIPANLKYYKTDFVSKDADNVSEELLKHIVEMIQLEHGIKIDSNEYFMLLSDEDADDMETSIINYPNIKALYISKDVLLTTKQNKAFENVEIHIIPDYYFKFELREVGEAW